MSNFAEAIKDLETEYRIQKKSLEADGILDKDDLKILKEIDDKIIDFKSKLKNLKSEIKKKGNDLIDEGFEKGEEALVKATNDFKDMAIEKAKQKLKEGVKKEFDIGEKEEEDEDKKYDPGTEISKTEESAEVFINSEEAGFKLGTKTTDSVANDEGEAETKSELEGELKVSTKGIEAGLSKTWPIADWKSPSVPLYKDGVFTIKSDLAAEINAKAEVKGSVDFKSGDKSVKVSAKLNAKGTVNLRLVVLEVLEGVLSGSLSVSAGPEGEIYEKDGKTGINLYSLKGNITSTIGFKIQAVKEIRDFYKALGGDPNDMIFPVGSKTWKLFKFSGPNYTSENGLSGKFSFEPDDDMQALIEFGKKAKAKFDELLQQLKKEHDKLTDAGAEVIKDYENIARKSFGDSYVNSTLDILGDLHSKGVQVSNKIGEQVDELGRAIEYAGDKIVETYEETKKDLKQVAEDLDRSIEYSQDQMVEMLQNSEQKARELLGDEVVDNLISNMQDGVDKINKTGKEFVESVDYLKDEASEKLDELGNKALEFAQDVHTDSVQIKKKAKKTYKKAKKKVKKQLEETVEGIEYLQNEGADKMNDFMENEMKEQFGEEFIEETKEILQDGHSKLVEVQNKVEETINDIEPTVEFVKDKVVEQYEETKKDLKDTADDLGRSVDYAKDKAKDLLNAGVNFFTGDDED